MQETQNPAQEEAQPSQEAEVAPEAQTVTADAVETDAAPSLEEQLQQAQLLAAEHHDAGCARKPKPKTSAAAPPRT